MLDQSGFPERFLQVDVIPPAGITKEKYVEDRIIDSFNKYNSKVNIQEIKYEDLITQFPKMEFGKSSGLVVEDILISDIQVKYHESLDHYIYEWNGNKYARKILFYTFFTIPKEESRNILIAQMVFPLLLAYVNRFIKSPSYDLLNHPIYLVNIINKQFTAQSILRPIAGLISGGFEYIDVFEKSINPRYVPKDIELFVDKYLQKSPTSYYSNDFYSIDFKRKILRINTSKLVIGDYLEKTAKYISFKGSSEKFYWIQVLPIILIAKNNEYKIDYKDLEDFYYTNVPLFRPNSEKLIRFKFLIDYIKKISI